MNDMNAKKLERAIELGKRVEHFFLALVGADGFPYVNSARQIEQVAENQLAIEEWICPLTVKQLSENPKMAVLIWDPAADDGYEILGEVLMFESQAFLNGFAPEVEEDAYLPQVKRKLIIRAERITAFSHALRCDDIQLLAASRATMKSPTRDGGGREVPFCNFAPEWAEHARFDRSDDPCDDGRAGGGEP
ncbi:MAG: pyridoxamine 5'-phosphate oxidase family protein [Deltaproteobacteria bacterium]|nr:pyridoxamine 5'-phosphate oxidase family protein [Deltaproteobacteria bacterium]